MAFIGIHSQVNCSALLVTWLTQCSWCCTVGNGVPVYTYFITCDVLFSFCVFAIIMGLRLFFNNYKQCYGWKITVFCCSMTYVCASDTCVFSIGIEICSTEVVGWPQESCKHISHVVSHSFIHFLSHFRAFPLVYTPSSELIFMVPYLCWSIQCDTTVDLYLVRSRYSQLYMFYSGVFRDRCSSISPENASPREFLLLQPVNCLLTVLELTVLQHISSVVPVKSQTEQDNLMPEWEFFFLQYECERHLFEWLTVIREIMLNLLLIESY